MKIKDLILNNKENTPWCLFTPSGANKEFCVLWIQGWSSSMDSHREGVEIMAEKSGVAFATLDYAGHGLSKVPMDESTRSQQLEEATAVFDELKAQGFKRIIVIGGSWGGYIAALLCGKRSPQTVVLRVPANYPDDEFNTPYKHTLRSKNYAAYTEKKETLKDLVNSSATRAIENYDGFVYVIAHELDEVVPEKIPRSYFESAKQGNYLVVPNTKHSPKTMDNPKPRFEYIEHLIVAIIEAVKLQGDIK